MIVALGLASILDVGLDAEVEAKIAKNAAGHTLASVCPSCAERAKNLRAAQCREGWHLEDEPVIEPDDRPTIRCG